jgi:hypothetical protein
LIHSSFSGPHRFGDYPGAVPFKCHLLTRVLKNKFKMPYPALHTPDF